MIPVQGPNSARAACERRRSYHAHPPEWWFRARPADRYCTVLLLLYTYMIYVAQRRCPRIFYIYMTYTRLHNILLYYTHTQTNARIYHVGRVYRGPGNRLDKYIPTTWWSPGESLR